MTITEEINDFIAKHGGNVRDALNIALNKISVLEQELASVKKELEAAEAEIDSFGDY